MPKSQDKTKGARKRKKTPANSQGNTESDGSEKKPNSKKKKVQKKRTSLEGIEMSKQLAAEVQNKRTLRKRNPTNKKNEPRLLGNGKPMPSLAELEAMYADSEGDEDTPMETTVNTTERSSTPISMPLITEGVNLDSPETLKRITSKVIDIISKTIVLDDDDVTPPPVIRQKKPKKSGIPHIVGCKERPQVPWAPKVKFGVGDEDFGIENNAMSDDSDDEHTKKLNMGCQPVYVSKSIFNAKSDEIAERLKELDTDQCPRNGSPDSNKTIEYNLPSNSPKNNTIRSFSPLPSTSRDSETIKKNDILFNESLNSVIVPPDISFKDNSQTVSHDVEIIEIPAETIVIDDLPTRRTKAEKRYSIDLNDDDCCILDEPQVKKKRHSESLTKEFSPAKDDIYGSIDLTETFNDEVFVIDDDEIENLIAENEALLNKNPKFSKKIETVTAVDPSVIVIESNEFHNSTTPGGTNINNNSEQITGTSLSMSNANNPEFISRSLPSSIQECVDVETTVPCIDNQTLTQASQDSRSNEITEVVTNFFNQRQSTDNNSGRPNNSTSTSELTNSQSTTLSRISSWISSIESFFSGSSSRRRLNANNDVIIINDDSQTLPNNNDVTARCNSQTGGTGCNSFQGHCDHHLRVREVTACCCHCSQRTCSENRGSACYSQPGRSTNHRMTPSCGDNQNGPVSSCYSGSNLNYIMPPRSDQGDKQQNPLYDVSNQPQIVPNSTVPNSPARSLGDCPICMDNLANTAVASTMCGHVFCMRCIKAAIRTNGKKCPTCRKALKGIGYHQLFI